jgi:mono/diheme cytochrome c family protein
MNTAARWFIAANAVLIFQAQAWAQKRDVGQTEYLSSCGACHGSDARGRGPMADQLKVAPADLTQLAKKNGGIFPVNAVYEKIDGRQEVKAHGTREMPVWGLSIHALAKFIPKPISR